MNLYCCQLDITWEDKPANFARAQALLENAAPVPGSLFILPEMFATGFSMNVASIRENQPSETESFLSKLASRFQVFLLAGCVTQDQNGRGLNQALVINPDGHLIQSYTKMHPFSLGGETVHYASGSEVVTFRWNQMTVAPFICYDLRFPEIFRSAARSGVQLFVVIANWPVKRVQHWITLLQARAIENQAYVAGVNRCGTDPFHQYPGRSIVVDPHGDIIADADNDERVITAEIDAEKVLSWRADFPALKDMHPRYPDSARA